MLMSVLSHIIIRWTSAAFLSRFSPLLVTGHCAGRSVNIALTLNPLRLTPGGTLGSRRGGATMAADPPSGGRPKRTREKDFVFKHFVVAHENSALRVCTDSCILGAYVGAQMPVLQPDHILDVGGGCGLLSLMLAQAAPTARVEAVEIDEQSAQEAAYNMRESSWAERMQSHHGRIQDFARQPEHQQRFQVIISNPPFFSAGSYTRGKSSRRNRALHTETLSFAELLEAIVRLLHPAGTFFVMLPPRETCELQRLAPDYRLHSEPGLSISDVPTSEPHRVIMALRFQEPDLPAPGSPLRAATPFTIKTAELEYSQQFCELLTDYYLPEHLQRTPGKKVVRADPSPSETGPATTAGSPAPLPIV
jgi:tRNA1Val (adenine37-N6)-methyltransferase